MALPLSADVIESSTACSTDHELGPKRAYNGELGVLSSTTNTIYGVYGLSGGASEYVMGNKTTSDTQSGGSTSYMKTPAQPPVCRLIQVIQRLWHQTQLVKWFIRILLQLRCLHL